MKLSAYLSIFNVLIRVVIMLAAPLLFVACAPMASVHEVAPPPPVAAAKNPAEDKLQQARAEGYSMAVANLEAIGSFTKETKDVESTYEEEKVEPKETDEN